LHDVGSALFGISRQILNSGHLPLEADAQARCALDALLALWSFWAR
jgi:hypothetical protein